MAARRPSSIPPGSWPPRMMADLAAGYCGEKHVDDFLDRVGKVYPRPRVEDSQRRRFWYREDLDRAMGIGGVVEDDIVSRTRAKLKEMREKQDERSMGERARDAIRAQREHKKAEQQARAERRAKRAPPQG